MIVRNVLKNYLRRLKEIGGALHFQLKTETNEEYMKRLN